MFLSLALALTLSVGSPESPDLVVHEWGTFTNFQTPDGTQHKFTTSVGEDLPSFVWGRAGQRDGKHNPDEFVKATIVSRHRMETPVIYFYSPKETKADVEVKFPDGLITEFYPPATAMAPSTLTNRVSGGAMRWENLRILAPNAAAVFPEARGSKHYPQARGTDANPVQFEFSGSTFTEKFLFYRGVADFELPYALRASGKGAFTFTNSGKSPLASAFLIEVKDGQTRFTKFAAPVGATPVVLPSTVVSTDDLAAQVREALVRDGLYPKEAESMVNTWRSLWFGESGTRVLYCLPRTITDSVLPLEVSPAPAKTERVFVGRMEILTPEAQKDVMDQLANLDTTRDESTRNRIHQALWNNGRFSGTIISATRAAMGARTPAKAGSPQ